MTTSASLGGNYYKLWASSAVSNLGDGVRWTALPLLAATITRDPAQVALISTAAFLPWFLFSLFAGALVDRWDRKITMAASNVFRALITAGLAAAVLLGSDAMWILYVVGFLLGTAETLFDNAAQSIMPALVPRDALEKANGRLYAAEILTNQFAGPPLGALLFTLFASAPFFVDAASFGLSAVLIAAIGGDFRTEKPDASEPTTMRQEIWEGLRWLWSHRLLRTLAIVLGIQNAVFTGALSVFVLYALEILEVGAIGYGLLNSVGTVGAVIGSLVTSWIARRTGSGPILIGTLLSSAVTFLVIAWTSDPFVVGAMWVVGSFVAIGWNVITVSLRQSIIPDHLLGRVNSAYRMLGWGMMPAGAALGGLLADAFGLRAPYLFAGVVYVGLFVFSLPVFTNRVINAARAATA